LKLYGLVVLAPDGNVLRNWIDDGEFHGIRFLRYTAARHGLALKIVEISPSELRQEQAKGAPLPGPEEVKP